MMWVCVDICANRMCLNAINFMMEWRYFCLILIENAIQWCSMCLCECKCGHTITSCFGSAFFSQYLYVCVLAVRTSVQYERWTYYTFSEWVAGVYMIWEVYFHVYKKKWLLSCKKKQMDKRIEYSETNKNEPVALTLPLLLLPLLRLWL